MRSVTVPAWVHAALTLLWLVVTVALAAAAEGSAAALFGALVVLQGTYAGWIHHHNGWA